MPVGQYPVGELGVEVNASYDLARAVRRIQRDLGFRKDRIEEVIESIQEAQDDLERGVTLPRFLLKEAETLALVAQTSTVALPSDFLRRSDNRPYFREHANDRATRLVWRDYDVAAEGYDQVSAEVPRVISIRNEVIYFFPAPERALTVYWDYYQKGAKLEQDGTNIWLDNAPLLLVAAAGMKIADSLDNPTAQKIFNTMFLQQKRKWYSETVLQEVDDVSGRVMGGNQ